MGYGRSPQCQRQAFLLPVFGATIVFQGRVFPLLENGLSVYKLLQKWLLLRSRVCSGVCPGVCSGICSGVCSVVVVAVVNVVVVMVSMVAIIFQM